MSEQTPEPVAETPAAPETPAPAAPEPAPEAPADEPSNFEKTKLPFYTRVRRDVAVEAKKVEGWFRSSDG